MKRITKKLVNSFFSLARSSLRIATASIKIITELVRRVLKELLIETVLFGVGLGLTMFFSYLGVPNRLALGLSIVILICILSVCFSYFHKSKLAKNKVKGEEKLADWIAQTLAQKAPQEWEEYQDWLHDILLDRFQMLDRGFPVWKVRMITYGRLTGFCVTISLIKLRRLAIRFRA